MNISFRVASSTEIQNSVTGDHSGQVDGYARMIDEESQKVMGYIEWTEYENKVHINMVETLDPYKRQGVATKVLLALKEYFPGQEIVHGMQSEEGNKWVESLK